MIGCVLLAMHKLYFSLQKVDTNGDAESKFAEFRVLYKMVTMF